MASLKDTSLDDLKKELQGIRSTLEETVKTNPASKINPNNLGNFIYENTLRKLLSGNKQKGSTETPSPKKKEMETLPEATKTQPIPAVEGLTSFPGVSYQNTIGNAIEQAKSEGNYDAAQIMGQSDAYNPALAINTPAAPMQSPQTSMSQGKDLASAVGNQPTTTAPGVLAGLKEGIFGMPQSNMGQFAGQEGRTTAYYAGKTLGDLVRSRAGLTTAGQESQLAAQTPGTPQYEGRWKAAAAAKVASHLAMFPMNLTAEQVNALNADLEKALPYATDQQSLEELVKVLVKKHGMQVGKPLRSALGLSTGISEEEKMQLLLQNIQETQAGE